MGILYGELTEDGYQPSWLHRRLLPETSGNTINGLGETEIRQPTPVYHRQWHKHPWYWVQESFYFRQLWDMVQGSIMFRSWLMDRRGHNPVAPKKAEGWPAEWAARVKEAALKDAMEHMFTKRNEREKLAKEYKRLLTIRKCRIKSSSSSSEQSSHSIAPSPVRVPPPSAERLQELLESDVADRAAAVIANGSRMSKSNSQPPQWFASHNRAPR